MAGIVALVATIIASIGVGWLTLALRDRGEGEVTRVESSAWPQRFELVALIGLATLVGAGAYGLLRWLPDQLDELRWAVSVALGIGATAAGSIVGRVRHLRRDLKIYVGLHERSRKWLSLGSIGSHDLERAKSDIDEAGDNWIKRRVAVESLAVLERMQARDAQLLRAHEATARAAEETRQREAEERARVAQKAKEQSRSDRALKLLFPDRRLPEGAPDTDDSQPHLLPTNDTLARWRSFKGAIGDLAPREPERVPEAEAALRSALAHLEGVMVPAGVDVGIRHNGQSCDAIAIVDGRQMPLDRALRFDMTAAGLTHAVFIAQLLTRAWSWDHGMYDRDYLAVVSREAIGGHLSVEALEDLMGLLGGKPAPVPGFVVRRLGERVCIEHLATRPGNGLYRRELVLEGGVVIDDVTTALRASDRFLY